MRVSLSGRFPILRLLALTVAALCIHGYHLGVEDGEIYLPAARKLLHPELYPFGSEFFLSHSHLSLFSSILAWTARLTHLSMDWAVLAWYLLTLFGMLAASWSLAVACFSSERARWCSVLLMTAVLSMPATNTSLLLMDPYLTARSFSTPLTLFALAGSLQRKFSWAATCLLLTALVHPQMVVYAFFLMVVILAAQSRRTSVREEVPALAAMVWALPIGTVPTSVASLLPSGFHLAPAEGPYGEALYSRDYYFLSNWSWYHWLGMLAPLAILAWFWKGNLRGTSSGFRRLSFAMLPFGVLSIAVGLVFSSSHLFDMFARLQPMRCFHLITLIFVLLVGGVIGEYWARNRAWVVAAITVPLAVGMFFVARATYPASPQIELPSETSSNAWVNTLLWIRHNSPTDAVFAVDSRYFKEDGVDVHGFRAVSERSELADYFKDGGVVSLFPNLAPEWKQMSNATYGLNHFKAEDFQRLQQEYPAVSWTVVHGPAPAGLGCPYQERGYSVCRLSPALELSGGF